MFHQMCSCSVMSMLNPLSFNSCSLCRPVHSQSYLENAELYKNNYIRLMVAREFGHDVSFLSYNSLNIKRMNDLRKDITYYKYDMNDIDNEIQRKIECEREERKAIDIDSIINEIQSNIDKRKQNKIIFQKKK